MTHILGLDIGGANLKAAHTSGHAATLPFALWQQPQRLAYALLKLSAELPAFDRLAVTMTGELCDCFPTKAAGVAHILAAVQTLAPPERIRVWRTDGRFADVAGARAEPLLTAAANWQALATFAGRFAPHGPAVLLDIGSTTSDLIPLLDGRPVPRGKTDRQRLQSGELLYTGVTRTPVCALLGTGAAAELFATMRDVYLLLGELPEADDLETADGRPATRACAHARLARMLCADAAEVAPDGTLALARRAAAYQLAALGSVLRLVLRSLPGAPQTWLLSGSGELLARKLAAREGAEAASSVSLAERLGPQLSVAACAHAVAVLARERAHG